MIERSQAGYADSFSMKITCTVCLHPDLVAIRAQLAAGVSQQKVADAHGLSRPAVQRHLKAEHDSTRVIEIRSNVSPCGVAAHAPGVDLMTRFLHQDRVLEEANEAGYSEHEARAKIISLRQQGFDCCADDLLYWLLPEIKGEYSKTDPLWTRQRTASGV